MKRKYVRNNLKVSVLETDSECIRYRLEGPSEKKPGGASFFSEFTVVAEIDWYGKKTGNFIVTSIIGILPKILWPSLFFHFHSSDDLLILNKNGRKVLGIMNNILCFVGRWEDRPNNCTAVPFTAVIHPTEFQAYVDNLENSIWTNNTRLVGCFKARNVVVCKDNLAKSLVEHPEYMKWKDEMDAG